MKTTIMLISAALSSGALAVPYPIVDTGQTFAYGNDNGQDAHYSANAPSYTDNGDGTVTDQVTGLMWTQDPGKKMTFDDAIKNASQCKTGGYSDWRMPTIKELYSLIQLNGTDPDPMSTDTSGLKPFIDDSVFKFTYGKEEDGDRIIDSQFATCTKYVSTTMGGSETMFGVNFADGRIKGYPIKSRRGEKTFYVLYVRDNPDYGKNKFKDNGDRTVTDKATGLTWMKTDSGKGMDWPTALEFAEGFEFAGHDDWRLPSAKELQSIIDYTRSPDTTGSAAIDPIFDATEIKNEGGKKDFAQYWTSSSHLSTRGSDTAVYFAFGRSLGFMQDRRTGEYNLMDVHGAGSQRSDPKVGDASQFPHGRGPQGDVIRIENMVRLVRGGNVEQVDPPVARETRMRKSSGQQTQQRPDRQQSRGGQGMSSGQRSSGGQAARSAQGGRPRDKVRARDTEFKEKFPEGSALPDSLQLYNVDHERVAANSIFKAEYTVVVGGCLTCPEYRNSYPEIEAVAADYRDKGVQFYFLYQSLTHPENWGFVQPTSLQERFAQVEYAKELLQTSIPWLTDTMDNEMKQYFAMAPNAQFVFDRDGEIVHRDSWGRGSSLRESLEKLVGPSDKTTTVADLNLPQFGRKTSSANGLLEPQRLDGVAVPLRVAAGGEEANAEEIKSSDFGEPNRYVKLRPEADQQLIQTGTGQLYLGFRQDPVLGAAWNNLATPPKYRITAGGATVTPAMATAPELSVESDTEPREFLVDVKNWKAGKPIKVEIQYFACNKEKGWCEAVEQEFTVWLEEDATAGKVAGRSHFPGGNSQAGRGGQGQPQGQSQRRGPQAQAGSSADRIFSRYDTNGDGKITKAEFIGPERRFTMLDKDKDGTITCSEAEAAPAAPNRGTGQRQGSAPRPFEQPADVSTKVSAPPTAKASADKPNIVFIYADDMGWTGTSVEMIKGDQDTRSDFYQTPNLEKMAAKGMVFSQAYSPGPMCTPSRAAVLTGKTPAELHITTPGGGRTDGTKKLLTPKPSTQLPKNLPTIGTLLKSEGYATALLGKWHIGRNDDAGMYGFDFHDGSTENASNGTDEDPKEIFSLTERGIRFMEENVKTGTPFYLQLSHYAVHTPDQSQPESISKFEATAPGRIHKDPVYAGMTWDLDTSLNLIFKALEDLNIANNTYVVFMSDNGAPGNPRRPQNTPLNAGKGSLYEGGIRVPLIINGTGIKPGSSCQESVTGCDLLPTFCQWAGIPIPGAIEGSSLVPLLAGKKLERTEKTLLFHYPHYGQGPAQKPQSAIIEGDYKLLKLWETDTYQLFDLSKDIGEQNDLSKSNPEKQKEMVAQMEQRLKETGAQVPTDNPNYDPDAAQPRRRRR
ncbi:sulfatase-like hydrolase/transferase [Pontiella sulfatireligans]|uniref:Arylsulfatase n=1 Tax=Pontiella sulfatireligans TaxID=2750658 RepID=A0A6C2UIP8_9BACT|nr:sulfatase-like hydrolase/transferase [Pontiella sulfatireligans]SPS74398.1 sulfatase S1_16 [Kiritimatiellales bacterium]VGO19988.1 Arylsulfatase [Pontiella sulfatireligans]